VKRTSNRAPGKNDRWWPQHQQNCGGTFIKVKEPEKKVKNKENKSKVPVAKKPKTTPKKEVKESPGADIRKFFKPADKDATPVKATKPVILPTSGGNVLGGSSGGRSRLLDMFEAKKTENKRKFPEDSPTIVLDDSLPFQSFHDTIIRSEFDDDDEIIFIDDEFDDNLSQPPPKVEPKTVNEVCHCPVCNVEIEMAKVNEHLDQCLGV
jgi:SprT-like domain-contaning protein Spartan